MLILIFSNEVSTFQFSLIISKEIVIIRSYTKTPYASYSEMPQHSEIDYLAAFIFTLILLTESTNRSSSSLFLHSGLKIKKASSTGVGKPVCVCVWWWGREDDSPQSAHVLQTLATYPLEASCQLIVQTSG